MLRPEVLATLCCPDDHSAITLAGDSLLREINSAMRGGRLRNRAGRILEQAFDGGLATVSGGVMYPIIDGIPVLVADEAIPLAQLEYRVAGK